MAHVHVPYKSVVELIDTFQHVNMVRDAALPGDAYQPANFVLVEPEKYFGSYGGLMYDAALQHCRLAIRDTHSLCDSIGHGMSLVWWNTAKPKVCGNVYALSAQGRVAVTPTMFEAMRINTVRRPSSGARSSYYAPKAWRINAASASSSDSE